MRMRGFRIISVPAIEARRFTAKCAARAALRITVQEWRKVQSMSHVGGIFLSRLGVMTIDALPEDR
jgi:hypothetical protein